jgi:hypothetical protein
MKINWVFADRVVLDPLVNIDQLKKIGSLWGSWQTWRACQTDNVICNNAEKAQELVDNKFQTLCNFYIPNSVYATLDHPVGIQKYEGAFVHEVDNQDEIVAMHLAASTSDIILLLGFDFTEHQPILDQVLELRAHNYRNLIRHAIMDYNQVQWVVVDHPDPLDPNLANLPNISTDTLQAVLALASD